MKQHSTKRRVLSILLSAMMLLSMVPAAVFQSSAAAWEGNDADPGWHIYADNVTDGNWDWQSNLKYLSTLLNAPGNFQNTDWYFDWLPHDGSAGNSFIAVLDANVQIASNDWMDGSKNDGNYEGYYTGLNVPLYAQFNNHMYSVTNGYIVTLNADDFDLTFQGPGTVMGNKGDAAIVINKGHMSFTDGLVMTNTGDVVVDVKSAGVIDLISDATFGAEGNKIGLRNEGTITSITGGTFYNFDNKGTVGSITGGTFDYSQAPEGVSFEQIRSAVAENATVEEISTGVFQVTSEEDPGPEPLPEDPDWNYEYYDEEAGTVVITGYKGAATELVVPAEVQGYKVVGLANGALYGPNYSQYFSSITISEGIEFLGDAAVMFNGSLTSLTLPSTLTTVGDDCFALSSVLQNVELPAACVNFVDDPAYDCPLKGSENNNLGIFYGLGASVAPATVTCYTEAAKAELEKGNEINTANGNPTYNINYIPPAVPVTVTFDANGGENAPAAVEVNANEAYTLPGAGDMTRENYTFVGWALSAEATVEDVVTEITPTEATTVYAVWAKAPKDGGANMGTVAPGTSVVFDGSHFITLGNADWGQEDVSNLLTRDVTFEMVDGKLKVVAVVYDEDLVTVTRPDSNEWETECFELMIDPYNNYSPADAATVPPYRDNLIQLRINTAGRLSGRWLAETLGGVADDQLPTESAFDGKFQGNIAIDGAWLTYTFVVDLSEFGVEGGEIGFDVHAVSCPNPEKPSWQYTSFYVKADGTHPDVQGNGVWDANKWDYLTLSYEEVPETVTVTFDANGGENAPAAAEVPLDETYTLPTEIGEMAKEGYKFIGWALSADATVKDVVTEITPTEATTVYAVWAETSKNGGANVGTVAPGSPVVFDGSHFITLGNADWGQEDVSNLLTRDVTFEMVDGKLKVVAVVYDEDLVTVTRPDSNEWETECFELMIDPYNNYSPADTALNYRDNLIQLRINTAGRLSGRWMAETLGGVADDQLPTESAFDGKFQGNIAIDGAWLTYTFVVDLSEFGIEEGGEIGFDVHAVSCPNPEKPSWQYTSFYVKADGTHPDVQGNGVWDANKWDYLTLSYEEAPATVTVTFDANGGENAPAAVEVPLNEVYTLPTEIGEMVKEGYKFVGWALSADATAEDVVTEITPTEATTVYAVWAEETVPCEHPEDQRTLVVDENPGYYFHGVGHYECGVCGETVEEDVDIAPLPLTDAYNDVNPDAWYVPGVAMMTDLGIMTGTGENTFAPDNSMLRSEMAMVMYQMLGDPEEDLSDVELPFTDVAEDHWAIDAIKWCYKHGIVSGDTPTTFAPDAPILREEFVSMFYRYMVSILTEEEYQELVAGIDPTVLDQFPDGAEIDDYAVEAMQVFVQAGIITGSDGMLAARDVCSRGQIAQIVRSVLELGMM